MKKSAKRLSMSSETIRRLGTENLRQVAGGTQSGCTVTCPNVCSGRCPTDGCPVTITSLQVYCPPVIIPSIGYQGCR